MSNGNTDVRERGVRYPVQIDFTDTTSRTKQSFKDECDINNIVKQFASTGLIAHQSPTPPTYGDFDNSIDYQTALNALNQADQNFADLPAVIRDRMNNDPGALLDFLDDPTNDAEAIELGLKPKPETRPPATTATPEEPEAPANPPPE